MRPSPDQQPPDGHLRPATPPPRTASSNPQTQGTTAARSIFTNSGDNSDGGYSSSGMHGSANGPRRFYSARRPAAARAGEGDYNKDGERAASSGPSGPGVGIGQMPQAVRRVGIPQGEQPTVQPLAMEAHHRGYSTLVQPRVSVKPRQNFWEK